MNPDILERYIEKVYGYAVNRTYSREEADELSQEIMYTALRNLHKLRDEKRFEPWLWGIADNVTKSFRRSMGKQRAVYSYDVIPEQAYEESFDAEQEEMYDFLRTKIAMLSELYRNIIILHYYDGLSTKKISALIPKYSAIVDEFVKGYKKLFPKHLSGDAERMCQNMFIGMYTVVIDHAQRTEKVSKPTPGCYCDVIRQFK